MATSGENYWPPTGRTSWPLTDLEIASALAHSLCSRVAVKAAEECVQLHGGIGFTWEHPAHLLLKRAKSSALMFGGSDRHRERLGSLVGISVGSEVAR
ncbi:acyl-CoA/acyl-ACP dehydrogenase [Rhodococcus erythropolis]|uniref:Acyl-CoA/acyl-ACP dehydrogenase n=1 Tax=Rhodococcus erythropolis TaxID=1833 RepID=A0A8I0ZT26_RHOER|nr:acyl-CoA/acyl-ACP dehydrogenase [Rhodococcus erythropolis]